MIPSVARPVASSAETHMPKTSRAIGLNLPLTNYLKAGGK